MTAEGCAGITAAYETWLGQQIPVVEKDLAEKHRLMATDEVSFFRATYYLWLVRVLEQVPQTLDSARTPIVGDLHAENFGTWRDDRDALRWGVNDVDELGRGPWILDPLRLATSAALSPHITLHTGDIASVVLSAYAHAVPARSPKVSDRPHLAAMLPDFKDSESYFAKLAAGVPASDVPTEVQRAAGTTVPATWSPTWYDRQAGAGSLGHRRVVGVGRTSQGQEAREAKQLDPGTAAWAHPRDARLPVPAPELYERVTRALEAPSASVRAHGWQIRALTPDAVRIELSGLGSGAETLLLTSMVEAMVVVHAVDPTAFAQAQAEAKALDADVFHGYVKTMKDTFEQDFGNSR